MGRVEPADLDSYARDGFVVLRRFWSEAKTRGLLDAAIRLARDDSDGTSIAPAFVLPEANLAGAGSGQPEEEVSKIFRVHRIAPFFDFVTDAALVRAVRSILETDSVSLFGSQFIFKYAGAWGQPCHQDSHYFPFEPMRPVTGAWLATTHSSTRNGGLRVIAGSHREPIREHVPDRRPGANYGYMEIVDVDLEAAEPVAMEPGDLLLFDSYLMHFSTDNDSGERRAAMVCHFAPSHTLDRSEERFGFTIHDWLDLDEVR
jgi:phytanoyl-CoA hydroxylase